MVYLYRPDRPDGALFAVHHEDLEGGQLLDSTSRGRGVPASQGARVTPSKLPAPAPEVAGVEEGGTPAPQPEAAHRLAQGDGVGAGLLHVTPRHFGLVTGHESGKIILGRCLFRGQTITEVNQNWTENISHSKISQKVKALVTADRDHSPYLYCGMED